MSNLETLIFRTLLAAERSEVGWAIETTTRYWVAATAVVQREIRLYNVYTQDLVTGEWLQHRRVID